jgi:hypothetical protein
MQETDLTTAPEASRGCARGAPLFAVETIRKKQLDWISPLWYRQEPPISCTMTPPIELRLLRPYQLVTERMFL